MSTWVHLIYKLNHNKNYAKRMKGSQKVHGDRNVMDYGLTE